VGFGSQCCLKKSVFWAQIENYPFQNSKEFAHILVYMNVWSDFGMWVSDAIQHGSRMVGLVDPDIECCSFLELPF